MDKNGSMQEDFSSYMLEAEELHEKGRYRGGEYAFIREISQTGVGSDQPQLSIVGSMQTGTSQEKPQAERVKSPMPLSPKDLQLPQTNQVSPGPPCRASKQAQPFPINPKN